MIKKMILFVTIILALPLSSANAGIGEVCQCSSVVGDDDNLGRVCCYDIVHEPEDGIFDIWDTRDKSWTHTFSPVESDAILNAKLSINTYNINDGFDDSIDLKLYVDGREVPNAFDDAPSTLVIMAEFILDSSFYDLLEDGTAVIEIRNEGYRFDKFAIDYAQLDIEYNCTTIVPIDIKPGSDPSSFGAISKGKIPVAIFGSENFDVTKIVDSTVRFGDRENSGAIASHWSLEDKNSDGFIDKVYHFSFQETGLDTADTIGYLSGETNEGSTFVGSSDINIVGIRKTAPKGN